VFKLNRATGVDLIRSGLRSLSKRIAGTNQETLTNGRKCLALFLPPTSDISR
jgi:hypothetical protein